MGTYAPDTSPLPTSPVVPIITDMRELERVNRVRMSAVRTVDKVDSDIMLMHVRTKKMSNTRKGWVNDRNSALGLYDNVMVAKNVTTKNSFRWAK